MQPTAISRLRIMYNNSLLHHRYFGYSHVLALYTSLVYSITLPATEFANATENEPKNAMFGAIIFR